jgi:hypothetical protein
MKRFVGSIRGDWFYYMLLLNKHCVEIIRLQLGLLSYRFIKPKETTRGNLGSSVGLIIFYAE